MPIDSYRVRFYKQLGVNPNPATDTLLGSDPGAGDGAWNISTNGWTEQRAKIYATASDLAGNESAPGTVYGIRVLPDPMRVSGLVAWTLGEMDQTKIGGFSS